MAAIALQVTEATGYFRGDGREKIPFLTFGPVTLTGPDGSTELFEVELA
jgi:hypothetical protein